MLKKATLLTSAVAAGVLMSGAASAQLAGKNVILVHGFQPQNLFSGPQSDAQVTSNGEQYWSKYWNRFADARIDWDSNDRIEGRTADLAYKAVINLAQKGFCNNGCIFVTHSTGDIVTRLILDQQEAWTRARGLQPLKVLATIDLAGAGGGTELADVAVDIAYNDSWYLWPMKEAVRAVLGFDVTPSKLGVLNDLRPAKARTLATTPNAVPKLRFVGGGNEFLGVTGPFITGRDDGVVPLHSACGATTRDAIDSCSSSVDMDGKVTSVSGPRGLMYNHYPMLMGANVAHNIGFSIGGITKGGEKTFVSSNFAGNGLNMSFSTKTVTRGWWPFRSTYKVVNNSSNTHMSALITGSL